MDTYTSENTVSDSKEESIAKAIRLMQSGCTEERPLVRPNISTTRIDVSFVVWLSLMLGLWLVLRYVGKAFGISAYITHSVATIGCLMVIVRKAKSFVQNGILLYQKYAPEKMRRSCLFVPSCSEYMLLSIEKYGLIRGMHKGLERLARCHHPNGGEDYP
jgi:putative component of membrane protein insertase Oxa1/YidC/SpoIIIJ protein YidD